MTGGTQDEPKYEYVEYLIIFYVEPIADGGASMVPGAQINAR
jgi:hypothetical protein